MSGVTTLIIVAVVMFCILGGITLIAHVYNLNNIMIVRLHNRNQYVQNER